MRTEEFGRGPWARTLTDAEGTTLPRDRWQPLASHLRSVGEMARSFGAKIGAPDWAFLAGLWHDLGKYHPDFQRMLVDVSENRERRRVDHSTAGAIHAARIVGNALRAKVGAAAADELQLLLTATIAGHHGGLADGISELEARLGDPDRGSLYEDVRAQHLPEDVVRPIRRVPSLPIRLRGASPAERQLRLELLIRMVLSALVDADRLDAERFHDVGAPGRQAASDLRSSYASIAELRQAVDAHIDQLVADHKTDTMTLPELQVFDYRQAVLRACRTAAAWSPGAFSLDVATGGGKTLSSLSFALGHAERHRKDRVIVVIPFTSIIEQTAREYRAALDGLEGNLVEHHSALNEAYEQPDGTGAFDAASERRRRATENWDAPLIVTTAVQFFESLFASHPSRCRKAHNVANAVVVIDEAQTLPPELLEPTVWVINELIEAYGATVVLSTATQPALERPFPEVRNLRRIIPGELEPPSPRVRVELLGDEPIDWRTLASDLAAHRKLLCITHRRDDARRLTIELDGVLGDENTVHLSALMCPAHRSARLSDIRALLGEDRPCRVVSTQLVEAGVDLDFPIVYRALAGVDSLVQAAGRANREGRLGMRGGLLRIYRAPTEPPAGLLKLAKEAAALLFESARLDCRELDLFAPATGRAYFRQYYGKVADKDHGVTALRREFRFRAVNERYRFIRDGGIPVIIPWDDKARRLLWDVEWLGPSRTRLRGLQPYSVGVYPLAVTALVQAQAVAPLILGADPATHGTYVLRAGELYHDRFGLDLSRVRGPDPEAFIA